MSGRVTEALQSALSELLSSHVQNNMGRMGVLGVIAINRVESYVRDALEANAPPKADAVDLDAVIAGLRDIADFDTANGCTTGEGHSDAIYKARELLEMIDSSRSKP